MKISFLIPSKDRLSLLSHAIESIRTQPELDYEIVVVDNASAETYEPYIRELGDPRVVFKRQAAPVSVTENWKQSLALASGDYILMLGDDDALAPDFSATVGEYLARDEPDVLYLASYHYCYPGVMPGQDAGYLASVLNSEFLEPGGHPFCLTHDYAVDLANGVLEFRHRFGLNAQHYLLKASFVAQFDAIGSIYQSPYPDTFSSVAIFLHAKSIVVLHKELVIIGISPKSFGAYYFSGRHDEGYVFLDNLQVTPDVRATLESAILPGDRNDTNWLVAAEAVRQAFPGMLRESVDIARYRALQMVAVLRTGATDGTSSAALDDLRTRLTEAERPIFAALEAAIRTTADDTRGQLFGKLGQALGQYHPAKVSFLEIGDHDHVGHAIDFLRTGQRRTSERASVVIPAAEPERQEPSTPQRTHMLPDPHRFVRGVRRTLKTAVRIVRRTVESASAPSNRPSSAPRGPETAPAALPSPAIVRPWLVVYRRGEVFSMPVEEIDRFAFQDGDELSVEPAEQTKALLRTPEGHLHVQVAPGIGVRVPPNMRLVDFKGFSVPLHLIALTGAGFDSFDGIGRNHIENYQRVMGLDPAMTFLEIGSGAGRDAFQLIDFIGASGRYIGIDVQRESIAWCENNIGRKHPNFSFHHFNAEHELHNPLATKTTLDFVLPAADGSVDRVALGSVFTHIFEDEVRYYMKEIARVLKQDGLCYATFFLYEIEVVEASRRNNLTQYNLRFDHARGEGCYVNDLRYPTGAVAFTDEKMRAMIADAGLELARPYLKGMWSGFHPPGVAEDGQDVAVLRRASV